MQTKEAASILPTEPFWEAIATDELEERLEFLPWTATETATATEACRSDGTGCSITATATETVSSGQSWGT